MAAGDGPWLPRPPREAPDHLAGDPSTAPPARTESHHALVIAMLTLRRGRAVPAVMAPVLLALAGFLLVALAVAGHDPGSSPPAAHHAHAVPTAPAPVPPAPAGDAAASTSFGHRPPEVPGLPIRWSATSPATHLGDTYRLVVANTDAAPQRLWVRSSIMDHATHTATLALDEPLELGPGERRELTAVNRYGTANHFTTGVASATRTLGLSVTITDAAGEETARFTERAFRVKEAHSFRFVLPHKQLAAFLDLPASALRADRAQGLSLATIAARQGQERDALRRLLTDAFEGQLQQGLVRGELTPEQAEEVRARFVASGLDKQIDQPRHQGDAGRAAHHTSEAPSPA
jgi:hypothetical protein